MTKQFQWQAEGALFESVVPVSFGWFPFPHYGEWWQAEGLWRGDAPWSDVR